VIEIVVDGPPIAQGSKRIVQGLAIEANHARLRPWRAAVAAAAAEAMQGVEPLQTPVVLEIDFYFARPKAHYRADGQTLRDNAPTRKASTPDLDKLVRAFCDGLTGIVFRDDAQIVELHAAKTYGPARAVAWIRGVA